MRTLRSLHIAVVAAVMFPSIAVAADHAEAPLAGADPAADITDLYAWHDANHVYAALGFAGLSEAGAPATYDADILYTIHIDQDGDHIADLDVLIRFGQNAAGEWGVQAENLPGASGTVSGPVESTLESGNAMLYSGPRDDPFFFDLTGYIDTLSTGSISFDSTRDSLAGTNITAVVVAMDIDTASGGNNNIQIWATTGRK